MPKRRRCATCGKVLTGPIRGGRVYCDRKCWPSRPAIVVEPLDTLEARRAETVASLERGEAPGINILVLRRIDQQIADRSRQGSNGKKSR